MPTENQDQAFELNGSQPTRPLLLCFQVGDCDWVAATDEDEARRVLAEMNGDDPSEYADWDVALTSDSMLDRQWIDEGTRAECGCLRQWLAEATEPTYLIGTEGRTMSIIDDVMTDKITLHGLGFVQVQLEGNQRLHVWHPELPRRTCFEHSAIHDHRFNFTSRVIVGMQINHCFKMDRCDDGGFMLYLHEGARTAGGGRPWTPDGRANFAHDGSFKVEAGNDYNTIAYEYHATMPAGDGRVATIMAKRGEYPAGAHSTCTYGVQPDTDFDRYQWSPTQLWEIVADVMLGQQVAP